MIKRIGLLAFASVAFLACNEDDDNDITGNDLSVNLYASSNTSGAVAAYEFENDGDVEFRLLPTVSSDGEGIYVNTDNNELTQVSRSAGRIELFGDLDETTNNEALGLVSSGSADLDSPRDIAVSGDFYVVSDNSDVDGDDTTDDGRIFIYTRSGNTFTLRNTVTVDFAVWGIEFIGSDLYAVVDKTSDVALFSNFVATNTTDAVVTPNKRVTIEGIVRTHGIGQDGGTVILTDIGSAAVDNDGGFHIITDFTTKFGAIADGGVLVVAGNQVRVSGDATFLGNPVSTDYDADSNTVYIAERANGGGRVLAYTNVTAGGNVVPNVNNIFPGASSVYFSED